MKEKGAIIIKLSDESGRVSLLAQHRRISGKTVSITKKFFEKTLEKVLTKSE